jgi:hypothetical protein
MADQPVETAVSGLTTNPPFTNKVSYSNTAAPIPVASLYTSAAASGLSISNTNPNFRNAYTETFNLNVQQALPLGLVASVGYYGSVGKHLRIATNENQPIAGNQANRPYLTLSATSPIDHGANIASNITEANSISNSNYNAMWLTLGKSMGHGLEFNVNYDWTKSMDENSLGGQGGLTLQDSNNPAGNYGLSDFDVRNHVAGTMVYALPFKGNRFVSGYRLNAIFQFQSGNPVNITASSDTYTGVSGVVRPNQLNRPITFATQSTGVTNVQFIQATTAANVCNASTVSAACDYQIVATQATPAAGLVYNGLGTRSPGRASAMWIFLARRRRSCSRASRSRCGPMRSTFSTTLTSVSRRGMCSPRPSARLPQPASRPATAARRGNCRSAASSRSNRWLYPEPVRSVSSGWRSAHSLYDPLIRTCPGDFSCAVGPFFRPFPWPRPVRLLPRRCRLRNRAPGTLFRSFRLRGRSGSPGLTFTPGIVLPVPASARAPRRWA